MTVMVQVVTAVESGLWGPLGSWHVGSWQRAFGGVGVGV